MMAKLKWVTERMQFRFIQITKHPLLVEEGEDGFQITVCAKGVDIPRLSLKVIPSRDLTKPGLTLIADVIPNDTGLHDVMLDFADKLRQFFPDEKDFPQVELMVEPGKFYKFTVFTKPITGGLDTTWEQAHARRLIESAMLACWSPLEPVRDLLVPGLFRKEPALPVVKAGWETGGIGGKFIPWSHMYNCQIAYEKKNGPLRKKFKTVLRKLNH